MSAAASIGVSSPPSRLDQVGGRWCPAPVPAGCAGTGGTSTRPGTAAANSSTFSSAMPAYQSRPVGVVRRHAGRGSWPPAAAGQDRGAGQRPRARRRTSPGSRTRRSPRWCSSASTSTTSSAIRGPRSENGHGVGLAVPGARVGRAPAGRASAAARSSIGYGTAPLGRARVVEQREAVRVSLGQRLEDPAVGGRHLDVVGHAGHARRAGSGSPCSSWSAAAASSMIARIARSAPRAVAEPYGARDLVVQRDRLRVRAAPASSRGGCGR